MPVDQTLGNYYQELQNSLRELDLEIARLERAIRREKDRRREVVSNLESTTRLMKNMGAIHDHPIKKGDSSDGRI